MGDFSALAARIKELRSRLGLTQSEFSKDICTSATLSAYENGSKSPSLEIVKSIALKYNVSIDWLCGITDVAEYDSTPKTYTDIIKLLFNLGDTGLAFKRHIIATYEGFDNYTTQYDCIGFDDPIISLILDSWEKTYNLYIEGTIDSTIYTAWKDKVLKDLDLKLMLSIGESGEYYNYINSLPLTINNYDRSILALKHVVNDYSSNNGNDILKTDKDK